MSASERRPAPGGPGLEPHWTSSAKSGVGTAFDGRCHVWFTISHGIVDEVYYPRVDQANTRDFGFLVTDAGAPGDAQFFSEEKRDTESVVHLLGSGVPGYRLVNRCRAGRYQIIKTVVTDPERDVLLQHVRFRALVGSLDDYRVFSLIAPHIGNQGYGNDGWYGDYKGVPMLFARRGDVSLALASTSGWRARSCGYVGVNDGWRQVREHRRLTDEYTEALDGNIALTGEIDLAAARVEADGTQAADFVLALAFGSGSAEAAQRARMTLASPFDHVADSYVESWRNYHDHASGPQPPSPCVEPEQVRRAAERDLATTAEHATQSGEMTASGDPRDRTPTDVPTGLIDLYWTSAAVLICHEDKLTFGAMIASLSIPWGQCRGDHEMGGYHVVWPRDLVEAAGGLLAAGHPHLARRTLRYLMSTQEADGRWPQNMWLDGTPYWRGVQMDETALPILFVEMLRREGELADIDPWPMIRSAAAFLVRHGPATEQDRWEEDGGFSPFTLAAEIAALVVAGDYAERVGEHDTSQVLHDTADAWNENVERWTYVRHTEFAKLAQVDGYYARIAPPDIVEATGADASSPTYVPVRNQPAGKDWIRYENLVSPDALALVRFGLRDANDERIRNTVRVIDALLCRRTKTGPTWYRYNSDGYGEHDDGSAFNGVGVGRGWPLLAGERGHYELARGNPDAAMRLLAVMRAQASDGGMIPEQIWDGDDIPERELWNGRPTGSAMPLVWAHAEYVKLARSLRNGVVFDTPDSPYDRYVRRQLEARHVIWSPANKTRVLRAGRTLRIQTTEPVLVHWSADAWRNTHDTEARNIGALGIWITDLNTNDLATGTLVDFTLFYPDEQHWEATDYRVTVT